MPARSRFGISATDASAPVSFKPIGGAGGHTRPTVGKSPYSTFPSWVGIWSRIVCPIPVAAVNAAATSTSRTIASPYSVSAWPSSLCNAARMATRLADLRELDRDLVHDRRSDAGRGGDDRGDHGEERDHERVLGERLPFLAVERVADPDPESPGEIRHVPRTPFRSPDVRLHPRGGSPRKRG